MAGKGVAWDRAVKGWDGAGGAALLLVPCCLCPARNGALSRSALLILLAGGFMGFSRELGSPEMLIIGRSITGLHSGRCCLGCGAVHGPFLTARTPTDHSQGAGEDFCRGLMPASN